MARNAQRAATGVRQSLLAVADLLPCTPHAFKNGWVKGTRERFIGSYFLVYEVTAAAINIIRVKHVRQRYP
ncbi:MAG: type II toxin-antitoxin system RelE/ParE family toxin [Nevskiaceae bacterium]|nr:type II toxin-antitoxin system RelE/ParE family toxin [Nevskiaceae bacterium]